MIGSMTKIEVAAPQPKEDTTRKAPVPARSAREDAPERSDAAESDDRWAHMPCTD
jgi:hypothetical protein